MAIEIERRFRVAGDAWRSSIACSSRIIQGYLAITDDSVIRVRVRDARGYVTIKSRDGGVARQEFEYAIPLADAQSLLKLCGLRILEKTRHNVDFAGYCWEVDEYSEPLEGLILAEVELSSETDDPTLPPWIGDEITLDGSFSNAALAKRVEAARAGSNPRRN
jgi:CYTH domain-containing protein